ncbi:MAG: AMP-binding protein [Pseudobdellovibrionaceae bacterium]
MASSEASTINLFSEENEILLNPRWPKDEFEQLFSLARKVQDERGFSGHVWIATSGSTAESIAGTKLVAISKQALRNSATAVNLHLHSQSSDVWAQVLPTFHVGGLGIEIRAALSGTKVISALYEHRWNVDHFYEILKNEKCTLSALVPTQIYDLVSRSYKAPESLRAVVVGGGAFDPELYRKARELNWPVLPSYGMTETASQIATATLDTLKVHGDFPDISLLSHAEAERNEEGFLKVKASSLFTCYAQNTRQGIRHWDPKIENWFTTEDKGEVICGNLIIEGRSKDYIKIGGEGTNLARLRSVLESCALAFNTDWASRLALLDVPSQRLGSEIHLVSLLGQDETSHLVNIYNEKVLPFERIRQAHSFKEIPRNELGKILWGQLQKEVKKLL